MYETKNRYGKLTILIHNAGKTEYFDPLEMPLDVWDDLIQANFRSVFLCTREMAKLMTSGGAIISIAWARAFMAEPHCEAYASSKGGIIALTYVFASSLAPRNITVNCISPGWIETGDYNTQRVVDHQQHFNGRVGHPQNIKMLVFI